MSLEPKLDPNTEAKADDLNLISMSTPHYPACFMEAQKSSPEFKKFNAQVCESVAQAESFLHTRKRGVFVFAVNTNDDLGLLLTFLNAAKKEIKNKVVYAVVFLSIKSEKIEDTLIKGGCLEILDPQLSIKALSHKLNRYASLLNQTLHSPSELERHEFLNSKTKKAELRSVPTGSALDAAIPSLVQVLPALTENWDFWLLRKRTYFKKINQQWIIELIGPAPSQGKWVAIKNKPNAWMWEARKPESDFDTRPAGDWIFMGRKPVYSWHVNRWAFVAENPDLSYYEAGKLVDFRVRVLPTTGPEVRLNSKPAIAAFSKIKATFDQDYILQQDELDEKNLQLKNGADAGGIPWADKTNTKDLSGVDWNFDESEGGSDGIQWNGLKTTAGFSVQEKEEREAAHALISKFKTGAEAMEECGVKATLNDYPVAILSYSCEIENPDLIISFQKEASEKTESLRIKIEAQNIEAKSRFDLAGKVTDWSYDTDSNEVTASIDVGREHGRNLKIMADAIELRQKEVDAFMNLTKGII